MKNKYIQNLGSLSKITNSLDFIEKEPITAEEWFEMLVSKSELSREELIGKIEELSIKYKTNYDNK